MEEITSWIRWGYVLADRPDPISNLSALAEMGFDADPSDDDLRRYLGDRSPHGPHREYRRPRPCSLSAGQ